MSARTRSRPMTVPAIVADLARRGVRLDITPNGDLRIQAPPGTLSAEEVAILRTLKDAVVRTLTMAASAPAQALAHGDTATAATAATAVPPRDQARVTITTITTISRCPVSGNRTDTTCAVLGCGGVIDVFDEHGTPYCSTHRPDSAGPAEPAPEPPSWRCRCGSHVSGLLPRCPTCLRRPDGTPSPCAVCGAGVVRRPPPPRDVSLRTPRGEAPVGCGPALEPFCARHRRAAHVLWCAVARGWPRLALPDGAAIGPGRAGWLRAVSSIPEPYRHDPERWYLRLLIFLSTVATVPPRWAVATGSRGDV